MHGEFVYGGDDDWDDEGAVSTEVEPPDPDDWSESYELLQCLGCETVSIRHERRSWDFATEQSSSTISFFPPRLFRRMPQWHHNLPTELQSVVSEVYAALGTDSRRLAMMGARTIVDMVAVDKVGDVGNFKQKLNTLFERGHISQVSREHLDAAFDAGSAAAHRGHSPSQTDVSNVMDIVENLLHATYVLNRVAEDLKARTPKRSSTH